MSKEWGLGAEPQGNFLTGTPFNLVVNTTNTLFLHQNCNGKA